MTAASPCPDFPPTCAGKPDLADGLTLLDDPAKLSADLVHPSLEGHEQIATRWLEHIRGQLARLPWT